MAKKQKKSDFQHETEYVAFLEKRLASKNFQANSTPEEVEKTKEKLKKARLKLKFMKK